MENKRSKIIFLVCVGCGCFLFLIFQAWNRKIIENLLCISICILKQAYRSAVRSQHNTKWGQKIMKSHHAKFFRITYLFCFSFFYFLMGNEKNILISRKKNLTNKNSELIFASQNKKNDKWHVYNKNYVTYFVTVKEFA